MKSNLESANSLPGSPAPQGPTWASAVSYSTTSTRALSELSRRFYTPLSASSVTQSRDPSSLESESFSSHSQGSGEDNEVNDASETRERNIDGGRRVRDYPLPIPQRRRARCCTTDDPQTVVLNYIMQSRQGRATLSELASFLEWGTHYERVYGDLREFLQSYRSLFLISPVDDTVTVQTEAVLSYERSRLLAKRADIAGGAGSLEAGGGADVAGGGQEADLSTGTDVNTSSSFGNRIGSVSYASVAERFDLDVLAAFYKRRGYQVTLEYDVLRVTHRVDKSTFLPAAEAVTDASFDMYLFPTGGVVWWGFHRSAHHIVEKQFLSSRKHLVGGVDGRHAEDVIEELFPSWCTFEVEPSPAELMGVGVPVSEGREDSSFAAPTHHADTDIVDTTLAAAEAPPRDEDVDAALMRFSRHLRFGHYILPGNPVYRDQVMLAVSHCLARSARMDYFEHITRATRRSVLAISGDFRNLLDYFSTKKTIDSLSGELLVAQLAIKTLKDSPDFLWEMPWLQPFYDLTDAQYASEHRLSWFAARSDALLQQLESVKGRRFRLFMLGSDVFLIVLLILDVFFMTSRLVVKLYFRLPEDE